MPAISGWVTNRPSAVLDMLQSLTPTPAPAPDASPATYPTQDLIFGIFAVILAGATLAVAVLQVIQFQIHRRDTPIRHRHREHQQDDENGTLRGAAALPLGVIGLLAVQSSEAIGIPSIPDSSTNLVPVPATSASRLELQGGVPQSKPIRIDSGIVMQDEDS